ncbi:MAG TPA: hypothetical protein VEU94_00650 [Terriglobales bacterium]|nr:hypothetical protein [Terriglobales bacterium]
MGAHDTKDWRDLFDVALFEPNRVKLRQRIEQARHVINDRLDALTRDESGSAISERIALSDALTTLAELHKIVFTPKPSASVRRQDGRAAS